MGTRDTVDFPKSGTFVGSRRAPKAFIRGPHASVVRTHVSVFKLLLQVGSDYSRCRYKSNQLAFLAASRNTPSPFQACLAQPAREHHKKKQEECRPSVISFFSSTTSILTRTSCFFSFVTYEPWYDRGKGRGGVLIPRRTGAHSRVKRPDCSRCTRGQVV